MLHYQFSIFDLYPYIFLFVIFFISLHLEKQLGGIIIFIALLLFSGLRYNVGWDYESYVKVIVGDISKIHDSRYEPISRIIFLLGNLINFYPFVFITYSTLTLFIVHKTISKYSLDPVISWIVFFSLPLFFLASLSTIRQSLATSIIFFSYSYLKEKKVLIFLMFIIIASLIHYSAVFGIFLLPLSKIPIGRWTNLFLLIISFFVGSIVENIINLIQSDLSIFKVLQFYLKADYKSSTILQYIYYTIGIINLIFYKKLVQVDSNSSKFITITNFGLIFYNLLSFEPVSAGRISAFFLIFWILLIPQYLNFFKQTDRVLVKIFTLGFCILISLSYLYLYINAYKANILEKISFFPYKTWINNL